MALTVSELPRRFIRTLNGSRTELADPDPGLTPEKVKEHYSGAYPDLAGAGIEGPSIESDSMVYRFTGRVGTKG
jgi:PRTRC genetic system protein C